MTNLLRSLVAVMLLSVFPLVAQAADPENTLVISLKDGDVTIARESETEAGGVVRLRQGDGGQFPTETGSALRQPCHVQIEPGDARTIPEHGLNQP